LQDVIKYQRFRIKRWYFAYVSANSTVTHHIRIFLIPSINLTSNAKIL